jgi:hypothetical protein
MRKQHKTKLRIGREILRTLQAHELRQADGGNVVPVPLTPIQCPPPPITGDSVRECCS